MNNAKPLIFLYFCFAVFVTTSFVYADYRVVVPGTSISVGEFVYNDDYTATTTPCTITIINPAGTLVVNAANMSTSTTGWQSYSYSVPGSAADGPWPTTMSCGSSLAGDLIKVDKTFIVEGTYVTSTSTIASAVWNNTSRTLSTFGTLAADVWSSATRRLTDDTLTSGGSLATKASLESATSSILTAVASASSSLSIQTQSASSSLSTQIQAGNTAIATVDAKVVSASSSLSGQILSVSGLISALNNVSLASIWGYGTRSLTDYSTSTIASASAAAVWANGTRSLTTFGSLAADVWASATRTLTGAGLTSGSLATASNVEQATSSILSAITTVDGKVVSASSSISFQVQSASSSLSTQINSIAASVWNIATSTLATAGSIGKLLVTNLDAAVSTVGGGSLTVADIWTYGTRTLTGAGLSSGSLATASNLESATSSILTAVSGVDTKVTSASSSLSGQIQAGNTAIGTVNSNLASASSSLSTQIQSASSTLGSRLTSISGLITALNNISAADVWGVATSTLTTTGSVGKLLVTNLDTVVSTIGGGSLTVADIWAYSTRSLTSFGTLASDINSNTNTTLGQATSTILASLASASSSLSTQIQTGNTAITAVDTKVTSASSSLSGQIQTGNAAIAAVDAKVVSASSSLSGQVLGVNTTVASASSSLSTQIQATNANILSASSSLASLISAITSLSVSDIWNYTTRTLTGANLNSGSLATLSDVSTASSSITQAINTNVGSQVTSAVSSINTNTDTRVNSASSSIASSIAAIPANVWAYSGRTLTSLASVAADVWNASTRTLTSLTLSSQSPWTVSVSDFGTITADDVYRSTVTTIYNGTLTDSANLPTITIYDPSRNVVINSVAMTRTATGTYEYAYDTAPSAAAGVWESVFSATVETGKTLPGNDYWNIVTNPAQVIVNSITDDSVPSVAANITITNEGLSGYEYQYEWCVVSTVNNTCGGGDDAFHALAAKYINPGEDFNTNLTATVPTAGNYYFKVIVYFGTESSGASRSFTAVGGTTPPSGGGAGGAGGGASGGTGNTQSLPPTQPEPVAVKQCRGADLNGDKKVNSIDFSIMMAFWKTKAPFKNNCVDINGDTKVDTRDFSILLSQWGTVGVVFIKK